jgi:hypothetical protein
MKIALVTCPTRITTFHPATFFHQNNSIHNNHLKSVYGQEYFMLFVQPVAQALAHNETKAAGTMEAEDPSEADSSAGRAEEIEERNDVEVATAGVSLFILNGNIMSILCPVHANNCLP